MKTIFVSGIHTDAGKTVVSAIICAALSGDYWKPVQSGTKEGTDKGTVKSLLKPHSGVFFEEAISLEEPLSPHAAANLENVKINLSQIVRPHSSNHLVIEGAGGLLVPLNDRDYVADLIEENDKVVLVSKHYLGSINHTLLSISYLNSKGIVPGVIYVGEENESTESAIAKFGKSVILGRVPLANKLDSDFVFEQGKRLKPIIEEWIKKI